MSAKIILTDGLRKSIVIQNNVNKDFWLSGILSKKRIFILINIDNKFTSLYEGLKYI